MTTPVPQAPPLQRIPNVELMHSGTWDASTGRHTFELDDLLCAVASQECPAVRRPILKLGHTDPRFDGQPAIGYVDNLAVNGYTLSGDYVGMPGWMTTEVLASAYPDRSIEGEYDFRCALGHTHPFVLTGVAFLGETRPAIGTLESLQDIATLYGVAASDAENGGGYPVAVNLKGPDMGNPRSKNVAAGVTTEDVRRAYYDGNASTAAAAWPMWIEEMHLEPLQLIVIDDSSGQRFRVPVTASGDGVDGVTFGPAVPVVVRYDDANPADPAAAADPEATPIAASAALVRFSSRAESRPGSAPKASDGTTITTTTVTDPSNDDPADPNEGEDMALTMTDEETTAVLAALGLDENATAADVVAAIEDLATTPESTAVAASAGATVASVTKAAKTLGLSVFDSTIEERLQRGDQAYATLQARDQAAVVDAALSAGKIIPSRREHFVGLMARDPEGTREFLEGLPAEAAVSLSEIGHGQDKIAGGADDDDRTDKVLAGWEMN